MFCQVPVTYVLLAFHVASYRYSGSIREKEKESERALPILTTYNKHKKHKLKTNPNVNLQMILISYDRRRQQPHSPGSD